MNTTDRVYFISFGYVYLGSYAILKVGSGWDTNSALKEVRGSYSGYPDDLYIPAGNMFIEFDASIYARTGFNLHISVRNITGKCYYLKNITLAK